MAQYIQTRLTNPSSEAIMARRRSGTSITPVRVSLTSGSKRRRNPSKARRRNPSKARRRNPSRRKANQGAFRSGLMLKGGSGIAGSLGRQVTLTGAGVAGAYLSNYLDMAFNGVVNAIGVSDPKAQGALKVATIIGTMTLVDQLLERANASEGARVATLVALYAGAGSAIGNSFEAATGIPKLAGTIMPHMRGTLISSPMLSSQLQQGISAMGGTNYLPLGGYMNGSLDVPNAPYSAPSHMQGSSMGASMGASADQGCI